MSGKYFFISILIILYALLVSVPVTANDTIHYEETWKFYGTFELENNDKVEVESYTFKLHEIIFDEGKATLILYDNDRFQRAYQVDTYIHSDFIVSNRIKVEVKSLTEDELVVDFYLLTEEPKWLYLESVKLEKGVLKEINELQFELIELNQGKVRILINYGSESKSIELNENDSKIIFGHYFLEVVEIGDSDNSTKFKLYARPVPEVDIYFEGLNESYKPGEDISYYLIIQNTGDVPLRNIDFYLEMNNVKFGDDITISKLEPSDMYKELIDIDGVLDPKETLIDIEGNLIAYTYSNKRVSTSNSSTTKIPGYISIEKDVRPKESTLNDSEFEVFINIDNLAPTAKEIIISDTVPDYISLVEGSDLDWELNLEPNENLTLSYKIKTDLPGKYELEPATLELKHNGNMYRIKSSSASFTLHGVKLKADRYLTHDEFQINEHITITIHLENRGTSVGHIEFEDEIGEGMELLYGDLSWKGSLSSGEVHGFTYIINPLEPGTHTIPELEVQYYDELNDKYRTVHLEEIEFNVNEDTAASIEQIDDENISVSRWNSFGFLISIFISMFAIISTVPIMAYLTIMRTRK